jgi:excisionase family DNA binding protein
MLVGNSQMLTTAEAARVLGVSNTAVQKMRKKGALPFETYEFRGKTCYQFPATAVAQLAQPEPTEADSFAYKWLHGLCNLCGGRIWCKASPPTVRDWFNFCGVTNGKRANTRAEVTKMIFRDMYSPDGRHCCDCIRRPEAQGATS